MSNAEPTGAILRPSEITPRERGGGARTTPLVARRIGSTSIINGITAFDWTYRQGDPDQLRDGRSISCFTAIKESGASNLFMLFDAFHVANAGIDPVVFVQEHYDRIAHVHIADRPGRREHGTEAINFAALFEALDAAD